MRNLKLLRAIEQKNKEKVSKYGLNKFHIQSCQKLLHVQIKSSMKNNQIDTFCVVSLFLPLGGAVLHLLQFRCSEFLTDQPPPLNSEWISNLLIQ